MNDALGRGDQVVLVDLEQFVPWVGFEDGLQGLFGVRIGRKSAALQHHVDLVPDNGYFAHGLVVGAGGEEPEKVSRSRLTLPSLP